MRCLHDGCGLKRSRRAESVVIVPDHGSVRSGTAKSRSVVRAARTARLELLGLESKAMKIDENGGSWKVRSRACEKKVGRGVVG